MVKGLRDYLNSIFVVSQKWAAGKIPSQDALNMIENQIEEFNEREVWE